MKRIQFLLIFMICALFAHSQVAPTRLYLHSLIVDEADIKYNEPGNTEIEGYFLMDEDSSGLMTWGRGLDTLKINNDTLVLVFGRSLDSLYVTIPGLSSGINTLDSVTYGSDTLRIYYNSGSEINTEIVATTASNGLDVSANNITLGNNDLAYGTQVLTPDSAGLSWNNDWFGFGLHKSGFKRLMGSTYEYVAGNFGVPSGNQLAGGIAVSLTAGIANFMGVDSIKALIEVGETDATDFTRLEMTEDYYYFSLVSTDDSESAGLYIESDSSIMVNNKIVLKATDSIYVLNVPPPLYADDAAADADATLPTGSIYRIAADNRALRLKP